MNNTTTNINYSQNPIINDEYNKAVNSMDDTKFTKIEESEEPTAKLSKFYYNTFVVGQTNAFENLANEYAGAINTSTSKMDEYVTIAQKAKSAIEKAIAKDRAAHAAAVQARTEALNSYPSYESLVKNGTTPTEQSYNDYCNARAAAGDKAYNETWNAQCWKPGQ